MSEGPKLYTNKPKKAHLKQFQEQVKGKDLSAPSSSSAAAASYTMGSQPTPQPPPPSPPPPPPKESFARRYKFLWPLLLAVNLTVGAYLFMRTKKKDTGITEEDAIKPVPPTPVSTTAVTTTVDEKPLPAPSTAAPVKLPEPIPESQQRELFKWILEEKRKIKPTDPEAKKRLDEEKALLKLFIRAKSIPTI